MQAQAELEAAADTSESAEKRVRHALATFQGTLRGMGEVQRSGDLLRLVNRPQEAVAALRQLLAAYDNYYATVADFNRAQFRLYHALGYPARILACDRGNRGR